MPLSGLPSFINDRLLRRFDVKLVRRSWLEGFAHSAGASSSGLDSSSAALPPVRKISTIAELDTTLKEVESARLVSDDAMLAAFQTFEFYPPLHDLPGDPFSKEYSDYQFALYSAIAGKPYQIANEITNWLSVEDYVKCPYPYYTGSYQIVSEQLIMIGLILKTLQLPPGAKILEFGAGYGNTTLALAQTGYEVTVIDIEQRFLDIITARCAELKNPPRAICADFNAIENLQDTYDAILFYGCFHHCSDHQRLASQFAPRLNPGGQVMFAAEPIADFFTMPWGLRLDGQSLWAVRNNGWLELGFTERYFTELMAKHKFTLQKYQYPVTALGNIFVARQEA